MRFKETLNEATITKLVTSFSSIKDYLPKGWIDSTQPMEPFGSNWGRGVFSSEGEAVITLQGTKHAQIRQRIKGETDFTFYWGYSDGTLYLEIASVRGNGFNRQNVPVIVSSILDRMKYVWRVEQKNIIFESNDVSLLSI